MFAGAYYSGKVQCIGYQSFIFAQLSAVKVNVSAFHTVEVFAGKNHHFAEPE